MQSSVALPRSNSRSSPPRKMLPPSFSSRSSQRASHPQNFRGTDRARVASAPKHPLTSEEMKTGIRQVTVLVSTASKSAIAVGPMNFSYDASSGRGSGVATHKLNDTLYSVSVDPSDLYIPPLDSSTGALTSITNLPAWMPFTLPPNFAVEIRPSKFAGTLNVSTGELRLEMKAGFAFRWAGIEVRGVELEMPMTSGLLPGGGAGRVRNAGRAWHPISGNFCVVGRAQVKSTGNQFMDRLINAPTDCFIELNGKLILGDGGLVQSAMQLEPVAVTPLASAGGGKESDGRGETGSGSEPDAAPRPGQGSGADIFTCGDEEVPCELDWETSDDENIPSARPAPGSPQRSADGNGNGGKGEKSAGTAKEDEGDSTDDLITRGG